MTSITRSQGFLRLVDGEEKGKGRELKRKLSKTEQIRTIGNEKKSKRDCVIEGRRKPRTGVKVKNRGGERKKTGYNRTKDTPRDWYKKIKKTKRRKTLRKKGSKKRGKSRVGHGTVQGEECHRQRTTRI